MKTKVSGNAINSSLTNFKQVKLYKAYSCLVHLKKARQNVAIMRFKVLIMSLNMKRQIKPGVSCRWLWNSNPCVIPQSFTLGWVCSEQHPLGRAQIGRWQKRVCSSEARSGVWEGSWSRCHGVTNERSVTSVPFVPLVWMEPFDLDRTEAGLKVSAAACHNISTIAQ